MACGTAQQALSLGRHLCGAFHLTAGGQRGWLVHSWPAQDPPVRRCTP
jgi:hypothetical protein